MHQAIQAALQSFDDAVAAEKQKVAAARQAVADAQRASDEAQHNVDQIVAASAALRQQVAADAPSAIPVAIVGDTPAAPSPGPFQARPAVLEQLAAAMAQVAPPAVPYPTTPAGA